MIIQSAGAVYWRSTFWFRKFEMVWKSALSVQDVTKLLNVSIDEDKRSCISNAYNYISSDLSKHVNVKYQLLADQVTNGNVSLNYVPTKAMVEEVFIKISIRTNLAKLMEHTNTGENGIESACVESKWLKWSDTVRS